MSISNVRLRTVAVFVATLLCTSTIARAGDATLAASELRCEYRVDPLGIDVRQPRLDWLLKTDRPDLRGQRQTAYHILVASTREQLHRDEGDLWDTGRVTSDQTNQIAYAGRPLTSRQQAWWKVRVWDGAGAASPWSEPARWTMGLLDAGDWAAQWIGYDAPPPPDPSVDAGLAVDLKDARWVWTAEADGTRNAPVGARYFRGRVMLPADRKVTRAVFAGTADNGFTLHVNGAEAGGGSDFHKQWNLDVTNHLRPGENVLAIAATNDGGPAALSGRLIVEIDAGPRVVADIDATWKAAAEEQAGWTRPDFDDAGWAVAKELGAVGIAPWGTPGSGRLTLPPPPYQRKVFDASQPVRRATVYATALGAYELHINGRRVGRDYFTPGWTDYADRVYYNTYDVTELVRQGPNALGAMLADGWYAGYLGFAGRRDHYGDKPRLRVQLELEYADGTTASVVTDETWRATYGPLREADHFMGTTYDARQDLGRWTEPGYDDAKWQPVATGGVTPPKLVEAYPGNPVRRQEELPARAITEPRPGVFVFDLGQNMVGWIRLKAAAAAPGAKVVVRYAEMINPDGTLYTAALRSARSTDTHIAADTGPFTWEPQFTFHGFRYVEVTGLSERPGLDAVTGVVVHNDLPPAGTFECSDPLVNQLVHNIRWGQKGNYLEVPTDCPQRDERLGWTGDAQFFVRTGAYTADVSAFFTKWLVDLIDDGQHPDGSFPDVAPDVLGGHGNVAWGDAGVICPYVIWQHYGDTRVIEHHYANMARYVDYLERTSKGFVRGVGAYGDWLNQGGGAKAEVIGTAYFAHVARLMSEMARAIGKEDDATRYAELADRAKHAFVANFVLPDGSIHESSQTGYALAFTMDLLPPDRRAAAAEQFVEEIRKKDWHLATGFIGTPRLLPALSAAGRDDVAYRLLRTDTFPSWLYQVNLGATTMWERWDGYRPDKGFGDPGMNSFNHYAFGSVGEWLYRHAAGIEPAAPGFKRITIRPTPPSASVGTGPSASLRTGGGGLTHAAATHRSINGEIGSAWRVADGMLTMTVAIPPNTTATVHVPAAEVSQVTEGGKPAREAQGVVFAGMRDRAAIFEVVSGRYEFIAPAAGD